ncbi:MAG TPA: zf-TFIIB domain-containing protein [Polyangiaceae bacterium]
MAEVAAQHARATVDTAAQAHCPQCHALLHRFNVTRARIELDACGAHGTWFDRGELGKVARELAVERAYAPGPAAGRGPGAGHLAAAAAVGVAGVGAGVAAQQWAAERPPDDRAEFLGDAADLALDIGGETVIHGIEVSAETVAHVAGGADFVGGAAELAGSMVEVGGSVLGGALEVLGSIFDGFG